MHSIQMIKEGLQYPMLLIKTCMQYEEISEGRGENSAKHIRNVINLS